MFNLFFLLLKSSSFVPRHHSLDQDGFNEIGYSVYKCFFSSTFDFDSFDEKFLLVYYYKNLNSFVLTNFLLVNEQKAIFVKTNVDTKISSN